MRKQSPCHECDEQHPGRRYFGCFADCDEYKTWRKERDEENRRIRNERYNDARLTHYTVEQTRKQKRRHR